MPNGSARSATARPIPPTPTSASVFPHSPPIVGRKFHDVGASRSHTVGSSFSNASICASTHSEIGIALAPREQVSSRSPIASSGKRSTPVPTVCTQRAPLVRSTSARFGVPHGSVSTASARNAGSIGSAVGIGTASTPGHASAICAANESPMCTSTRTAPS